MTIEQRTSKLIEALLIAQISNVDPDDNDTIMNRWAFLISDALKQDTSKEIEIRQDERRRMLLTLAILMLPEHDKLYDKVEAAFAALPALPYKEGGPDG